MKNVIKIFTVLLVSTLLFAACKNESAEEQTTMKEASQIVETGDELTLSEYRGKVVLLDFWATWCPPCRKGIPDLVELQKEYGDNLVVIGISLDGITRGGETADDVVPFMKEFGINYPIVEGGQDVVMQYGGIRSIPTSFIVDRRGFVISRYVGLVSHQTYVDDIEKALAGNYDREQYMRAPDFTLPTIK